MMARSASQCNFLENAFHFGTASLKYLISIRFCFSDDAMSRSVENIFQYL